MRAHEVLDALAARGVTVTYHGDRMHLTGKTSDLTPEEWETLRTHKHALLAALRAGDRTNGAEPPRPTGVSSPASRLSRSPAASDRPRPRPLCRRHAYYGPVGAYVRAIERDTEADPAALVFSTLVHAGNLLGRHVGVRVEEDIHFANLFVTLVGRSARGRKGTSRGRALRAFGEVDPDWVRDRHLGELGSGEGVIHAVRDANPAREDPGVSDRRLLVYEPELASVLAAMAREGSTLSAVLRQAWDGAPLHNTVKGSPQRATGAHISVLAHVTEAELLRLLTATERANGFGNRILWVAVERARCLPRGGRPAPAAAVTAFADALQEALAWGRARSGTTITWDADGGARWDHAYAAFAHEPPGLLGALTSRAEPQALRLSLLLALLDRADAIERAHVEAALDLWGYADDSVAYLFGDALGDPVADPLLAALRRAGPEGLTRTAMHALFGRHCPGGVLDGALAALERAGQARPCSVDAAGPTGGRPPERWRAVEATGERERSEEADQTSRPSDASAGFCRLVRFFRTAEPPEPGTFDGPPPVEGESV